MQMNVITIEKVLSLALCCCLILSKLVDTKIKKLTKFRNMLIFTGLFSILMLSLSGCVEEPYRSAIIMMCLSVILALLWKIDIREMLINMMISFSITYLIYFIGLFISLFFSIFVLKLTEESESLIIIISTALTGILQVLLALAVNQYKIHISFEVKNGFGGVCFCLSSIVFALYGLARKEWVDNQEQMFLLAIIPFAYGLFHIIKRETNYTFNNRVQSRILNDKEIELINLTKNNAFFAHRVHDNNKVLSATYMMLLEVKGKTEDKEFNKRLEKGIEELAELRKELAIEGDVFLNSFPLKKTEIVLLDSLLIHYFNSTKEKGVEFSVQICDKAYDILQVISIKRLTDLVGNLIENAIISTENTSKIEKKVAFSLEKTNGLYQLIVEDSGVKFSKEVLQNLGKKQITTYSERGGSGIGFLSIFKTLEQTKASLSITEYLEPINGYIKKIEINFNKSGTYEYHSDE